MADSGDANVEYGRVVQIAYAVADIRAAARSFAERVGAGPFFVRHHALPRHVDHRGQAGEFDHSSAYGQWGKVQVELVEIHHAAPASLAEIVQRTSGIHHVATFVESIDDEQRRLTDIGWPAVMTAETAKWDALRLPRRPTPARPPAGGVRALCRGTCALRHGGRGGLWLGRRAIPFGNGSFDSQRQ